MHETSLPHGVSSSHPIRSFVLRQGRISQAQTRYLAEGMPRWGVPFSGHPLDLTTLFGRDAPCILEIGCGMGETTAQIAQARPECNFLGIEVHTPGVGALLKEIALRELTNLRVIQHDAVAVLETMIAPAALSGIHLFFPDPWPKKRHHKRRLIQPPVAALLASRLTANGYLHCATDWADYAAHMLAVLRAEPALENTVADYAPRPAWRPQTKFETRGLRLGHTVHDLLFTRRPDK